MKAFISQSLGQLAVCLLVFLSCHRLGLDGTPEGLVVWNVGQGQWVTWVDTDECWHFDAGGQIQNAEWLTRLCRHKRNRLLASHWDWDHIGLIPKLKYLLDNLCLQVGPLGSGSEGKQKLFSNIPPCSPAPQAIETWSPDVRQAGLSSNQLSHVNLLFGKILVPGDSDCRMEKLWSQRLDLSHVEWLVLGHHGSRTSTCPTLLSQLPRLRLAIASSKYSRYHHPHIDVVRRLRERGVILLRTEKFGSLFFEKRQAL